MGHLPLGGGVRYRTTDEGANGSSGCVTRQRGHNGGFLMGAHYSGATVAFVGKDGVRWTVREQRAPDDSGNPALIFESDQVVRRVTQYSQLWHELPPELLEVLSWNR